MRRSADHLAVVAHTMYLTGEIDLFGKAQIAPRGVFLPLRQDRGTVVQRLDQGFDQLPQFAPHNHAAAVVNDLKAFGIIEVGRSNTNTC